METGSFQTGKTSPTFGRRVEGGHSRRGTLSRVPMSFGRMREVPLEKVVSLPPILPLLRGFKVSDVGVGSGTFTFRFRSFHNYQSL